MEIPESILGLLGDRTPGFHVVEIDPKMMCGIAAMQGIGEGASDVHDAITVLKKVSNVLHASPESAEEFGISIESLDAQVINLYNVLINFTTATIQPAKARWTKSPRQERLIRETDAEAVETARALRQHRDEFKRNTSS